MIIKELFPFIFDLFESKPAFDIRDKQIPNMADSFYTYGVKNNKLMITHNGKVAKIGYDTLHDLYYIISSVNKKLYDYDVKDYKLYAYVRSDDYDYSTIDNYTDFNNINELTEEEILYLSLKYEGLGDYFV